MHRQKGRPNIPQAIKDEIVRKHTEGISVRELAEAYDKPFKTINGLLYRERLKNERFLFQSNEGASWQRHFKNTSMKTNA